MSILGGNSYVSNNFCSKFFKTSDEIESEKLEKGIRDSIIGIVRKREKKAMSGEEDMFGSDFLGLLLKACQSEGENFGG